MFFLVACAGRGTRSGALPLNQDRGKEPSVATVAAKDDGPLLGPPVVIDEEDEVLSIEVLFLHRRDEFSAQHHRQRG
jgi:hypothetical protein